MKISFIVLTYNRSDALLAVLRSLSVQCSASHEVLIADDGSRPDQVDMLYQQCPAFRCPVRHVWHADIGFTAARARNMAASLATGDYLVFLDGDCVPNRSFAEQHARLAESGCFVNGSRVLLGENLTRQVTSGTIDLLNCTAAFWITARLRGESNKLLHLVVWPWCLFRVKKGFDWHGIRSCNLGVWRSDFVAVNGFDEVFEGWGHEDADLVLRLSHFGVQRKNGFLGTEVFHLWHRENKRSQESVNRNRVLQRMTTDLIRAERGLEELDPRLPIKTTQLQ
ncbi:glycosyltransferase family 2 protein [Polaromonas sp.]|uniref:glycosyltransferase family 2 protein n=1 Tax=Polaromonas sp. TaxID=1869339 RepID=UPI0017A3E7DA|nr:glycosyltransferase family 2 protein [Polaromonas sp.]NML84580.1 glycosyltransferase [Polaromonas sp.]